MQSGDFDDKAHSCFFVGDDTESFGFMISLSQLDN